VLSPVWVIAALIVIRVLRICPALSPHRPPGLVGPGCRALFAVRYLLQLGLVPSDLLLQRGDLRPQLPPAALLHILLLLQLGIALAKFPG